MRIIRHTSNVRPHAENRMPPAEHTQVIEVRAFYPDSAISRLFISQDVCSSIYSFIQKSRLQQPVAEVGGFLLGKFTQERDGLFQTSVEIFVPSLHVANNSPIMLDFGIHSMIEWNEAQELHPELLSVGWFHTHPGHSPYLSNLDINLHEGFFPNSFQIALVVDPLTPNWDMGIFCRTTARNMIRQIEPEKFVSLLELVEVSV